MMKMFYPSADIPGVDLTAMKGGSGRSSRWVRGVTDTKASPPMPCPRYIISVGRCFRDYLLGSASVAVLSH
jgi:hypothetical protein